jgi:hypothetical protein
MIHKKITSQNILIIFAASFLGIVCIACNGGGGGSSDGTVIQGTLTQRGAGHSPTIHSPTIHSQTMSSKHASGERIEDVTICVLGECSITDGEGQWGVNIENFPGGELAITINGHGIDSETSVSLPISARDVIVDLGRDGNVISVDKLFIDGEDHTGHDHSH